jgi:tetratricopeptide (TPR) repeat protein
MVCLLAACATVGAPGLDWDQAALDGSNALVEGRVDDAEALWLRALEEARRDPDDAARIAFSLFNLSLVQSQAGRYDEAERSARESVAAAESLGEPFHPALGTAFFGLAMVQAEQGRRGEAELNLARAGEILMAHPGVTDPLIAEVLILAGSIALERGRHLDAELAFRDGCAIRARLFGDTGADAASCALLFGQLELARGRPADARRYLETGRRMLQSGVPAGHPLQAEYRRLAALLERAERAQTP